MIFKGSKSSGLSSVKRISPNSGSILTAAGPPPALARARTRTKTSAGEFQNPVSATLNGIRPFPPVEILFNPVPDPLSEPVAF